MGILKYQINYTATCNDPTYHDFDGYQDLKEK
jgi:hypothetical protein